MKDIRSVAELLEDRIERAAAVLEDSHCECMKPPELCNCHYRHGQQALAILRGEEGA